MLAIQVEFLRGMFEAGGSSDDEIPSWPPSPARLFNALVASADHDDPSEMDALAWLESLPSPRILASADVVRSGGRVAYVPTNQLETKLSSYSSFVARKGLGPRVWRSVSPQDPRVTYEWHDAQPGERASAIASVLQRLGYLGRSTSAVSASVIVSQVDSADIGGRAIWQPGPLDGPGAPLHVVQPGYLAELVAAHDQQRSAHEVRTATVRYRTAPPIAGDPVVESPYGELIILAFRGQRSFAANQVVDLCGRLREAIQSHLGGGPLVLRGRPRNTPRAQDERHEVCFAALPFVGHERATGSVLGVAVALPRVLEAEDRRAVLRGLAGVVASGLRLGRLGTVELDPGASSKWTLQSNTWCRPSKEWVSALPISSHRHLRLADRTALEREVRTAIGHLDLPSPEAVEVSMTPLLPGAQVVPPQSRVRHLGDRATASFHARVQFADLVRGPMILGYMRRYGLGLMLPVDASRSTP